MRRVDRESDLESALRDASSEALRSFQNDEVYIEKLVLEPRHIEIQVLGDHHGHMIHLGERECSIQRRHQKVIEECPSPVMLEHPELRARMGEAALKIARAAGYTNAGTCEFLVDANRNFYFLEMNTRLQVEHPVTELATSLDLVHWQLRIASGERLTLRQEDIAWRGSAIECRIYAEDPNSGFLPSPGWIAFLQQPSGPGIRLDSGVYQGFNVPMEYDPMLAKLIAWAPSRDAAIARMCGALAEYVVEGIRTNIEWFDEILSYPDFVAGRLSTDLLERFERVKRPALDIETEAVAALVAALQIPKVQPASNGGKRSAWLDLGRQELMR
jgi:acetyl-CoA carboxylase, biotin carboxylase subunit